VSRCDERVTPLLEEMKEEHLCDKEWKKKGEKRPSFAGASIAGLFDMMDEMIPAFPADGGGVEGQNRARLYVHIRNLIVERARPADIPVLKDILQGECKFRRGVALMALGKIATAGSFACIRDFLEANCAERSFNGPLRFVADAPAEVCLETARRWFASEHWVLFHTSCEILERHGDASDAPMVREMARGATGFDDVYRLCCTMEILAGIGGLGRVVEAENAFEETEYAPARTRAARVMAANDLGGFRARYARECLWDCESDTRKIGCENADVEGPGVRERLREIADDEEEIDDIREAARKRI
jgi:hypothetical protein